MIERIWCRLGLHRWSRPGGECESCGYPDVLLDDPAAGRDRLDEWRAHRV